MKTVNYKGYQASVEFDDGALFVKVLHIDDLLVAQCDSASEAQKAAEDLIDAYLEDCLELGREPSRPFKGSFNVRVDAEVHRGAAMAAAEVGLSLNSWVSEAIAEKLECRRIQDRVDNVFAAKRDEMTLLQLHSFASLAWTHQKSVTQHDVPGRRVFERTSARIVAGSSSNPWRVKSDA
ncbi:type II toxin-antitoxin system HicB family antitoxin [Mesorhizobium sp. B2-6-4]|uniref:type II toxin-antitoxin system HicB family antitoxin n=1 Tax=Mesorhizobium sp. B2-6-4 TaxID=2589913 RepID=UPI00112C0502|nr:type II toxin-antitoxin system HicB family antitoxin [Mesorhizobium sp. B2-6-4]TPJ52704.1 type II toxin-antitoxin system HicB family antitoxin [Mesorhizobium sp. B2-6-4]